MIMLKIIRVWLFLFFVYPAYLENGWTISTFDCLKYKLDLIWYHNPP